MVSMQDIKSLSEFQRNTRSHIRRLAKTGRPEVLTINGKAKVIVQDAAAYEKLLEELEFARTQRALEEADRGEGYTLKEAMSLIRKRSKRRP